MPFAGYGNFADCVAKNQNKKNPEGYCAIVHKKATGKYPSENAEQIIASAQIVNLSEDAAMSLMSEVKPATSSPVVNFFEDAKTRRVKNVEVFVKGTHKDSQGQTKRWSAKDIASILSSFKRGIPASVPIKLGHTSAEHTDAVSKELGVPAVVLSGEGANGTGSATLGRVVGLSEKNGTLIAELEAPEKVADLIEKKFFTHVSSEILDNYQGKGPVLSGLALLGAERPALKGLKGLEAATILSDGTVPDHIYTFSLFDRLSNFVKHWHMGPSGPVGHQHEAGMVVHDHANQGLAGWSAVSPNDIVNTTVGYTPYATPEEAADILTAQGGMSDDAIILADDIRHSPEHAIQGPISLNTELIDSLHAFSKTLSAHSYMDPMKAVAMAKNVVDQLAAKEITIPSARVQLRDIRSSVEPPSAQVFHDLDIQEVRLNKVIETLAFSDYADKLYTFISSEDVYEVPVTEEVTTPEGKVVKRVVHVQHHKAPTAEVARQLAINAIKAVMVPALSVIGTGLGFLTLQGIGGLVHKWRTGRPRPVYTPKQEGARHKAAPKTIIEGIYRTIHSENDKLVDGLYTFSRSDKGHRKDRLFRIRKRDRKLARRQVISGALAGLGGLLIGNVSRLKYLKKLRTLGRRTPITRRPLYNAELVDGLYDYNQYGNQEYHKRSKKPRRRLKGKKDILESAIGARALKTANRGSFLAGRGYRKTRKAVGRSIRHASEYSNNQHGNSLIRLMESLDYSENPYHSNQHNFITARVWFTIGAVSLGSKLWDAIIRRIQGPKKPVLELEGIDKRRIQVWAKTPAEVEQEVKAKLPGWEIAQLALAAGSKVAGV